MTIALALVGAYVVGSIDFAVIVARMHGVDERISVDNLGLGTRLMYRILDRFLAHAEIVRMQGKSYRLRNRKWEDEKKKV